MTMEALKDIPGYKAILKAVLKHQIQSLVSDQNLPFYAQTPGIKKMKFRF